MASLPRPSRPSLNPPSGPLPSIPVPKSRQSSVAPSERTPGTASSVTGSGSGLAIPTPTSARSISSSSIPTTASINGGTSSIPTSPVNGASAASPVGQVLQQEKGVRRTISYNSFPRPPGSTAGRNPSNPPSGANTPKAPSSRTSSLVNAPIRTPGSGLRTMGIPALDRSANHSVSPSVVGDDDTKSVKNDLADDEPRRGRPTSAVGGKDKGNVIISVRVRPEIGGGSGESSADDWSVDGRQALIQYKGKEAGDYNYDNVFTTHDKNARVYDSAAKRLVRRVMEGYHGTVFAYGMTGTGKTFSMQGTATSPGVIPLAITDIFSFIRETPQREFLLRVSYLEIYNERIHDLLAATPGQNQANQQQEEIKLREDSKRGVYATPLKEEIVQSPTQLLRVIARGDHARRTSSTQFNARSSRSHAVVQIVVESRERNAGGIAVAENKKAPIVPGGVRVSTLSLIDLAGSERAADSKERRTEGAHINKSLLTLGTVISKLSGTKDKQGNATDKDGKHLPYRDSKLTRLLQGALSGNSLISILCTIQIGSSGSAAGAAHHTMETLNTLKFAARARNNITSHAKKAEEAHGSIGDAGSRALLDRYRLEILELRKQLENQKQEKEQAQKDHQQESSKNKDDEDNKKDGEEDKAKEAEQDGRHEEQMLEMQLARTALKERIEHLNRLILSSKSIGVNRSYSSMGFGQVRDSTISTSTYSRSIRSSASTYTIDPSEYGGGKRRSASTARNHDSIINGAPSEIGGGFDDDEDTFGEGGDGTASLTAQIRALQADLADKNRYISTLEKRLIQARRSSRSRVSMTFRTPLPTTEEGGVEAILQAKDQEISELRERLDDKDRMVAALRSAARKRDTADTSITNVSALSMSGRASPDHEVNGNTKRDESRNSRGSSVSVAERQRRRQSIDSWRPTAGSGTRNGSRSGSLTRRSSGRADSTSHPASPSLDTNKLLQLSTVANMSNGASPISPATPGTPATGAAAAAARRGQGVDEMTRMLDEMIRQRGDHDPNPPTRNRGSSNLSGHQNGTSPGAPSPTTSPTSSSAPPSAFPVNVNGRAVKRNSNTRLSTDGSRLSGWEQGVSNRRRQSGTNGNGTTRSARSSGTAYSSENNGALTEAGSRLTPPTPGSMVGPGDSFNPPVPPKDSTSASASYFANKPVSAAPNGSLPTTPGAEGAGLGLIGGKAGAGADPMYNSTAAALEAAQALNMGRGRGASNPDAYNKSGGESGAAASGTGSAAGAAKRSSQEDGQQQQQRKQLSHAAIHV